MRDLEEGGAQLLNLDVTDDRSVQEGVERVLVCEGRVDVLLNNAGYGSYGFVECVPVDEVRYQFEVNVLGCQRLVRAVLPSMRARRSGRIVQVASVVSHITPLMMGWYAATKHAMNAMSEALRMEVRQLGIEVVQIEPGAVKTNFEEVAFAALDQLEHPEDYAELLAGMRAASETMCANAPGPERTVEAVVAAIQARRPKAVYRTTLDARWLPVVRNLLGGRLFAAAMLARARRAARRGRGARNADS